MAAKRKTKAREAQLAFEALSIEGGLLSPEWLSKVAQLLAGNQAEADYRIPKGLNLRDEIGRYWRIAQAHWADFKSGCEAKADAKVISERLVLALLRDAFGFTSLLAVAPAILAERSYPIGHAALGGRAPVVIAPAGIGLDTLASAFGDGTRKRSAFGLAQEYLNAQEGALWGVVTDGASLRIVRDNASLTRPAWIEADLQRIFTEERYADFAALWLLCHETRFGREGLPVTECALEAWRNAGREEGTRARQYLRRGVEEALAALGQGFLSHSENQALRADLQNGTLPVKDYFNQLLRLVYRFIFLLTVEERGLLHPNGTTDAAKALYAHGYGMRRLRERSVKRSAHDRFFDLWEATKVVFRGLAAAEPCLGLPALAGIFAVSQCPALDGSKVENRALLLAVFKLAWLRQDGSLSRVNWRDMGPEELGSVYESLLELVPQITQDGRQFAFAIGETKSNARHTTGSYYTPDSLVQVLLDNALEPVVADAIAKNPTNPVEALLGLSIVDPACGSGHFLLAAARRLAAHVARLQANGTPSAGEYRHALRQVVARCIFGVDVNAMAVELCKVGLWMEAVEPGLPLTFLDSHIQHGNALLGTTPALMAKGIPDAAWDASEGDDKKTASALKKRNKAEAGGQRTLDFGGAQYNEIETEAVTRAVVELDAASDADVEALARKEKRWDGILGSPEYLHQKLVADAWCAAFFWPKKPGELADAAPTNEVWRQLRDRHGQASALTTKTVQQLAQQLRFFHWHLQFPHVVAKGGFDVVLGNPPWVRQELLKLEKRFLTQFSSYASTADSSVYFIERGVQVGSSSGFVAMLTPNKWFRAAYAESLRAFVRRRCRVTFIVDFGHSRTLFPDADTFPALVALRPVAASVTDSETATFVRAYDSDLAKQSLKERIATARVAVAHASLKAEHWHLEDAAVTQLLGRLLATGKTLEASLQRGLLSGLKTGLNDAFYVDGPTRDALVALDPSSAPLFKKMLRGRDVKRWSPEWAGLWHIVIASSQNRTWPWSASATESDAEYVFAKTYPSVHQHLKKFEAALRSRQDRGVFWWELRSCDYYEVLDGPKLLVQCIAYYSQFALDQGGHAVNNKILIVPTDDLFLLAVLNSRVVWWIVNRTFQHMKDEGLSVDIQYLKKLPIPMVSSEQRDEIVRISEQIIREERAAVRARLELQLDELIMRAFAMTPAEQKTLVENLPPRDPLERVKADLDFDAGSTLPVMPTVVPQLSPVEETALFIWALVHAAGGTITRTELARAFALRVRPALLTQLAPSTLPQAGEWATRVGSRSIAEGTLAATLRALSERDGVTLGINSASQSTVSASQSTPTEGQLDPWFRFEAQLILQVLRAQPATAFSAIDASLAGDDRSLIEQTRQAA
ncbi:MAG TPA: N-6 DNA methylase [Aromatoleum sp.]|uniref:Eco57I restriction-modification methylase domain-containing protein n=1 Tax=Aromatoleum sp. TaxID=2307007 RepID=UPI002B47F2D3|nr:N-6 DNA methylase [Aromatoleum sp.]HJV26308.1 N-6 DNA methylase [Aromatoleum sp.]